MEMGDSSDSDADIDLGAQAVQNFNGLIKYYYQNPEVAEDMRRLAPHERESYVRRVRDKVTIAFQAVHDLWRAKRIADDTFNHAKAAEKLVLKWLADPHVAVAPPLDDSQCASASIQVTLTCSRDHAGYGEEALSEPDLESLAKSLSSLRACRGVVSSQSDANSVFIQRVVKEALLIHCRDALPAGISELIKGYSVTFQQIITARPRPPYRSFLLTEHVRDNPDVTASSQAGFVAKYVACRLASSAGQAGSYGHCFLIEADLAEMVASWGEDKIALYFRIPWILVEVFRCDVVLRLLNVHAVGTTKPVGPFLEHQLRSMAEGASSSSSGPCVVLLACTHRPFDLPESLIRAFHDKLLALSANSPIPNNDPNCLLEFDARYGSVVPGPAIVLRSCTSGYFVRSASRGSSASGSTPRPRQVCGPHCRPVVPVVDSDADVVTCNLRSAQALLFPDIVEEGACPRVTLTTALNMLVTSPISHEHDLAAISVTGTYITSQETFETELLSSGAIMLKDSRDNYVTFAPLLSDAGYTAPYFRDIHCQTPARLLGTPVPPQCVFQLLSVEYGGALEAVRDRSLGICAESLRLHVHSPMSPQLQLLVWQDVPACPPGGSEASAAKYPVDYDANVRVAVWRGNILNLCADVLVCPSDGKIFSPWRRPLASQVLAMSEHDKQLKRCASIPALGRASHCRSSGQLASRFRDIVFCHGPVVKLNTMSKLFRGHAKTPEDPEQVLRSVYLNVLDTVVSDGVAGRSVALPCISTGMFHFPKDRAADVAVSSVRHWLAIPGNREKLDMIIFVVYPSPSEDESWDAYHVALQTYFPKPRPGCGDSLPRLQAHPSQLILKTPPTP